MKVNKELLGIVWFIGGWVLFLWVVKCLLFPLVASIYKGNENEMLESFGWFVLHPQLWVICLWILYGLHCLVQGCIWLVKGGKE